MKFNDIDFYEHGGTNSSELGRHVRGYWVAKKFFELAWTNALIEIPRLDWSKPQTTETLCGTACWEPKSFGDRLRLGRCMKYFVDEEMLLLQVANPGKKGKRKFIKVTR
jgi:hypothetical protein